MKKPIKKLSELAMVARAKSEYLICPRDMKFARHG